MIMNDGDTEMDDDVDAPVPAVENDPMDMEPSDDG